MRDDGPRFSDHEKHAIDAIGRELDREYGTAQGAAASEPGHAAPTEPPSQGGSKLRMGLLIGAGTLALAALVTGTALVASRWLDPDDAVSPRDRVAVSSAARRSGPVAARVSRPVADTERIGVETEASAPRADRTVAIPVREASRQVEAHDSPCPPATRVTASSGAPETSVKRVDHPRSSSSARPAVRRESRPSTVVSMAVPARQPRPVEAP